MGVSSDTGNSDVSLAMAGGSGFVQRVQEITSATDMLQKALADLQLGREAKAAYDDAQAKLAEANDTLEKAKASFTSMASDARIRADAAVSEGESRRLAALAEANQTRQEAQNWADNVKAEAANAQLQAQAIMEEAQKRAADAADKAAEAQRLAEIAKAAQLAAADSKAKYDAAYARVKAALEDLNGAI